MNLTNYLLLCTLLLEIESRLEIKKEKEGPSCKSSPLVCRKKEICDPKLQKCMCKNGLPYYTSCDEGLLQGPKCKSDPSICIKRSYCDRDIERCVCRTLFDYDTKCLGDPGPKCESDPSICIKGSVCDSKLKRCVCKNGEPYEYECEADEDDGIPDEWILHPNDVSPSNRTSKGPK